MAAPFALALCSGSKLGGGLIILGALAVLSSQFLAKPTAQIVLTSWDRKKLAEALRVGWLVIGVAWICLGMYGLVAGVGC